MLRSAVLQELGETLVEVDLETSVIQPISQKSVTRLCLVGSYEVLTLYLLIETVYAYFCMHTCTQMHSEYFCARQNKNCMSVIFLECSSHIFTPAWENLLSLHDNS